MSSSRKATGSSARVFNPYSNICLCFDVCETDFQQLVHSSPRAAQFLEFGLRLRLTRFHNHFRSHTWTPASALFSLEISDGASATSHPLLASDGDAELLSASLPHPYNMDRIKSLTKTSAIDPCYPMGYPGFQKIRPRNLHVLRK